MPSGSPRTPVDLSAVDDSRTSDAPARSIGVRPSEPAGLHAKLRKPDINGIAYCCTEEGIHETSKETGIPGWALGCVCAKCSVTFERILL